MPHSVASGGSPASHKDEELLPDAPTGNTADASELNGEDNIAEKTAGVKLEDLFNDEDDDDNEFPASSAPADVKMENTR
jgi:DNA primase small subunit